MVLEQSVATKYTLGELIRRVHTAAEYVNAYVEGYDRVANPIQRVAALTKIVHGRLRLQILVKKLGMANLDAIGKVIRDIPAFVLKNPQYQPQLENAGKQIEENLKRIFEEESLERKKSDMLRKNARHLMGQVKPIFGSVRRKIDRSQEQQKQRLQKPLAQGFTEPPPAEKKRRLEQWKAMQEKQKNQLVPSGKK